MSSSTRTEGTGTLYVVPTPIGNLGDVTIRAIEIMRSCHAIAAEDTRRTRMLLERHGIAARSLALHRFNEERTSVRIAALLASGHDVAYVTDSGTPGISDPGARLVARIRAQGLRVVPLPGPSAPVAAVSVSGWEGPFTFEGFVERRPGPRRDQISRLARENRAAVLFEAPGRLRSTLEAIAAVAPDHVVLLAREMTKVHEEYRVDKAAGLLASLPTDLRGEMTLVLMPPPGSSPSPAPASLEAAVRAALELEARGLRLKDAARILAPLASLPASRIYEEALLHRR